MREQRIQRMRQKCNKFLQKKREKINKRNC